MGLFSKKPIGGGVLDVIRCDEPSYLIWKWHPTGTVEGLNRKENAIRWGSRLRVREGSVAVFVYKQKDGTMQDYIEGPFDETLKTANLPVISRIIGMAYEGDTPFQAEVYFINLAQIIQQKFAIPYFDIYDPRFLDFGVPTAVRGTISFKISDYKEFIKLHRLETFTMKDFELQIKDAVARYVKSAVANAPEEQGIPVIQIERKINLINEQAETDIRKRLFNDFGVTISGLDIAAIDVDKTSEGYQQLKAVTQDLTTQTMQAQTEVNIREMRDSQKLGVLERAGRIITNIKEDQYARHKQTQSANFAAYQTEAAEHVGVAGAEGLGKMGAGGAGNMSGGGMNPAAMMAGMAVGSAIGQNLAGNMSNMMGNITRPGMQQTVTPPPIVSVMYHVAVNGQPTGPFDIATLTQMVAAGSLLKESLVWTTGMAQWSKAGEVDELKAIFPQTPPPIPGDGSDIPPIPPTV